MDQGGSGYDASQEGARLGRGDAVLPLYLSLCSPQEEEDTHDFLTV